MNWFGKSDERSKHQYVEERLSAYLDGELSPQERSEVESHLDVCQDCQWNLHTLRQTVQWTRTLPTVPIPRVFTIPVPAQPTRVPRRRWTLPVLQGATALVAVLLFFVVAGDYWLTGSLPVLPPRPEAYEEQAPAGELAATARYEPPQAAEVEKQPATVVETVVVEKAVEVEETMEVEKEVVVEVEAVEAETTMPAPSALPAPAETVPAERVAPEAEVSPTPPPDASGMGVMDFGTPTEEGVATVAVTETEPSVAAAIEPTVAETGMVEPAPTPMPPPTESPTVAAPTVVAGVREPAEPGLERPPREEEVRGMERDSLVLWVGLAEIVLLVAFVLLAAATVMVMIRRRRTG